MINYVPFGCGTNLFEFPVLGFLCWGLLLLGDVHFGPAFQGMRLFPLFGGRTLRGILDMGVSPEFSGVSDFQPIGGGGDSVTWFSRGGVPVGVTTCQKADRWEYLVKSAWSSWLSNSRTFWYLCCLLKVMSLLFLLKLWIAFWSNCGSWNKTLLSSL